MFDIGNQEVKILTVGDVSGKILDVKDQRAWEDWKREPGVTTVAYWPLDSVNTVNDTSGQNNHLTNSSTTFGVDSLGVNCAQFTRSKYLYANSISGYPAGDASKTFNFWAYFVADSSTQQNVRTRYGNSSSTRTTFYIPGGTSYVRLNTNGTTVQNTSGNYLGAWKNFVVTYEASTDTIRIFVDGVLVAEGVQNWASDNPTSSYPFTIGRRGPSDASYGIASGGRLNRFIIEEGRWTAEMVAQYYNWSKKFYPH